MSKVFRLRPIASSLMLSLAAVSSVVQALPQGGVVAAGSASVTSSGTTMTVTQASSSAILDWRSFSVAANERVNFIQPSASASILNRVVGSDPSSILGQITANGRVFLVNTNGIIFGRGSRIDAAGLVASTVNISNENFMAARYQFDEMANRVAAIANHGEINVAQGGLVALVAPGVENSGIIRADLGRVVLASGNAFTLDFFGDKLVSFAVNGKVAERLTDAGGARLAAYVSNTGEIQADGGSVLITASVAREVVDSAINLSGVIRANSFAQRNGEIILSGGDGAVNISGTLEAAGRGSGTAGGNIAVTGRNVALAGTARLDASGDSGGGHILVGGDYQGGGTLAHADTTSVAAGATLRADGGTTGDGGRVVLWSDSQTDFAGFISARGGSKVGAGGTAETSSKGVLNYRGMVDLAALNGAAGFLLLDPTDLTIDSAAAQTLALTLRAGTNASATATNNVTLSALIDGRGGTAGGALTLSAGNTLAINADIYTNNGAATLTAGAGGITMAASGGSATTQTLISTGTGAISLSATAGNISAQHLASSGSVDLTTTTSGNITLNQNLGGTAGLGSLAVSSAGDATLTAIKTAGNLSASSGAASVVYVNGKLNSGGTLVLGTSGGSIKLRHNVTAASSITFNADILVNPQDEILTNNAGTQSAYLSAADFANAMTGTPQEGTGNSSWDPVAVRETITAGTTITFNKGLKWDGGGTITDANEFLQLKYFKGEDRTSAATDTRPELSASGTRYFVVQLSAGTIAFSGSGTVGVAADPGNFTGTNPNGTTGNWCNPGWGFVINKTGAPTVNDNAAYTGSNTANGIGGAAGAVTYSNGGVNLVGVGFAGAFTTPTPTTTTAAGIGLALSNLTLPAVQTITSSSTNSASNSTTSSVTNISNTKDEAVTVEDSSPSGGESPSEVADLGRGGSNGAGDPFSLRFQLVSGSSDQAGNSYFSSNLFDFAANKSKAANKDDERR